ncbi:MAG: hypothetical protein H7841_05125 [Magnetospirillum sp. WYHS-4]
MDRVLEGLDTIRQEIATLRAEHDRYSSLQDENRRLAADNAELREELLELVNDYAALVDRDYGTRREPQPSLNNSAIQRARTTLAKKGG